MCLKCIYFVSYDCYYIIFFQRISVCGGGVRLNPPKVPDLPLKPSLFKHIVY